MLDREYWVDYFSQFDRSAIEKLTENILEKRAGNAHRMAAEKRRRMLCRNAADETGGILFAE